MLLLYLSVVKSDILLPAKKVRMKEDSYKTTAHT